MTTRNTLLEALAPFAHMGALIPADALDVTAICIEVKRKPLGAVTVYALREANRVYQAACQSDVQVDSEPDFELARHLDLQQVARTVLGFSGTSRRPPQGT